MNRKYILIGSVAFALMSTSVYARTFDSNVTETGNVMGAADKQNKCFLYKMSVKGSNSFFGGNKKSIEATCQDAGGEDFKFSANGKFHKDLVNYAAQEVIIITAPNKGDNKVDGAKTNNILISIKPVRDNEVNEHKVCGPDNPTNIDYGVNTSKIYSSGYRVTRPVSFNKNKKQWHMNSYVGIVDDSEWKVGKKDHSNVTFTRGCAMAVNSMLITDTPLIFDYMQMKEGGTYTIGRAAVIE